METLPAELIHQILLQADLDTLDSLCRTDKLHYSICNDANFWLAKAEQDFGFNRDYLVNMKLNNPYYLYRFLVATDGYQDDPFSKESIYRVGLSGDTILINYYRRLMGSQYNKEYRVLTRALATAGQKDIIIDLVNSLKFSPSYGTPVYNAARAAAKAGHLDIVKSIIALDQELTVGDIKVILADAVDAGNLDIVKYLTGHGEELPTSLNELLFPISPSGYHSYPDPVSLIQHAINAGKTDIVSYIVEELMRPTETYPDQLINGLANMAVDRGNLEIAEYLRQRLPRSNFLSRWFGY